MVIINGKKVYKVAADAGHHFTTAGKRSPLLANGKPMHEFDFNVDVAKRMEKLLLKTGHFSVVRTYDETKDASLYNRVKIANDANADIFVSIHANAYGPGGWNNVTGIETFNCTGSKLGPVLAKLIQKELIEATGMVSRGVKESSFYVIRKTKMPAVLSENGFMTNKEDVKKLLSSAYRQKIAMAHAVAICKYFKVDYSILFEKSEKEKNQGKINNCLETVNGLMRTLEKLKKDLES